VSTQLRAATAHTQLHSRWHTHYASIPKSVQGKHQTIRLAMMKLGSNDFAQNFYAKLAALDCRVLIRFDPIRANSRTTQAELVKTYMRNVFNIPENREFMWSGYSSEPILAEAAARLLNDSQGIIQRAPDILESALNCGLLARGERGELVARTLFTVAHDRAIMQEYGVARSEPRFHRPLRLLAFLENLLAPDIWAIVREARPTLAYTGDHTFEKAFEDAWVNFTHFVQLGDHPSFNLHCASELLKRGAAMQAFDNQYNMDGGLPLLFGDPSETIINEDNTSMGQYQVKNTSKAVSVYPNPKLVGSSKKDLPIFSLIMQLGVEKDDKRVTCQTMYKGIDAAAGRTRSSNKALPNDIGRRHYVIVLYGCTSKVYACIPTNSVIYHRILRAQSPFADFPRAGCRDNQSSLYALKPMIYDQESACMSWS
jgi:hypothetical protein